MEGADGGGGGVFCYVNSVFAPGLDEGVGGLWRVSLLLLASPFSLLEVRMGDKERELEKRQRERREGSREGKGYGFSVWVWADMMVCSASRLTISSSWRIL